MKNLHKVLLIASAASFSLSAFAASFESLEQSAANLGTADAGTGTNLDNATIEFYNPAGITMVGRTMASLSAVDVFSHIDMYKIKATDYFGNPRIGNMANPESEAVISAFHIIHPFSDKFAMSFGATVPFGLETIYPSDSIASYFATKSKITTVNLGLGAAYKFTNIFSSGVGLDVQKLDAELNKAIDTNFLIGKDSLVKNSGSDWGIGFNLGLMLQAKPKTRLGLAYHSKIRHKIHGNSKLYAPASIEPTLKLFGIFADKVSTTIDLPDYGTFSIQQVINKKWTLMGDAQYTRWNSIHDLTLKFASPEHTTTGATEKLHYHNAWRFAIGQTYKLNNRWKLKNGFAYDQTPTSTRYKTVRIPDSDRYWITFGANYKISKRFNADIGYAFILFQNTHIHNTLKLPPPFTEASFDAHYRAYAQLVGVQLNCNLS